MKTIQKLSKAKFKVSTDNIPNSDLELDFNPLIEEFNLKGDFLLVHWPARPKGYRRWGIYASKSDLYYSLTSIDMERWTGKTLQLDDFTASTVPSAVLLVENARLIIVDEDAIVCTRQQLIDVSGDSIQKKLTL